MILLCFLFRAPDLLAIKLLPSPWWIMGYVKSFSLSPSFPLSLIVLFSLVVVLLSYFGYETDIIFCPCNHPLKKWGLYRAKNIFLKIWLKIMKPVRLIDMYTCENFDREFTRELAHGPDYESKWDSISFFQVWCINIWGLKSSFKFRF